LLAISSPIFTTVRFVGAAYLIYLGVRLWRAESAGFTRVETQRANTARQFLEGIGLQLANPNAILFFLAVFPQFFDLRLDHAPQFTRLVVSYALLVVIIHSAYALLAKQAGTWLRSNQHGRCINRVAGASFVGRRRGRESSVGFGGDTR
jgi:threonine/homoserine/homoserine lactone efflux protein